MKGVNDWSHNQPQNKKNTNKHRLMNEYEKIR